MKVHYWVISAISAVVLSACGGGSSNPSDAASASAPPASSLPLAGAPSGAIAGVVVASDTGLPLAGVQVQVAGSTGSTAADGSFSQSGLGSTDRQVVRFVRDGYADTFATTAVTSGATASVTGRMVPIAARTTFDNSAGTTLTDSNSAASVIIPPAAVVDAATGAAPQGAITLQIAAINPATNPANMPGNYTASTGSTIESFGALSVQLRDAAGKRLNLAAGKSATIRIPLASRSDQPQQTIPLFYFNETTGLWVEEGTATLAGMVPNQYYEGIVSHFSTWNADKVVDTIFVNGCLSGAVNQPLAGITVRSIGVDYSGLAAATTDAQGKFRVAIRRNGLASIAAAYPRSSTFVLAGPSATELTLPACLTLGELAAPVFVMLPASVSAPAGTPVSLYGVVAHDTALTYQWFRNGRAIKGETHAIYQISAVSPADDQAQFTVAVTNAIGTVTSAPATLTVTAAVPAIELAKLMKLLFQSYDLVAMVSSPLSAFVDDRGVDKTFWVDPATACRTGSATASFDGQALPVGTEMASGSHRVSGTFKDCALADNPSEVLNGTSNIAYTLNDSLTSYSDAGDIINFRRRTDVGSPNEVDLTGNGRVQFISTRSTATGPADFMVTMTPVPGSTLRDNLTGQLTAMTSGDIVVSGKLDATGKPLESITQYRRMSVVFDGVRYMTNGTIVTNSAGGISGQLILTRNGFEAGRLSFTSGGTFVDINGVVQRLG
jgi:hypothetical protein